MRDEAPAGGRGDGGHPAARSELAVDVVEVRRHGPLPDPQPSADLPRRQPLRGRGRDLALTVGEEERRGAVEVGRRLDSVEDRALIAAEAAGVEEVFALGASPPEGVTPFAALLASGAPPLEVGLDLRKRSLRSRSLRARPGSRRP